MSGWYPLISVHNAQWWLMVGNDSQATDDGTGWLVGDCLSWEYQALVTVIAAIMSHWRNHWSLERTRIPHRSQLRNCSIDQSWSRDDGCHCGYEFNSQRFVPRHATARHGTATVRIWWSEKEIVQVLRCLVCSFFSFVLSHSWKKTEQATVCVTWQCVLCDCLWYVIHIWWVLRCVLPVSNCLHGGFSK